MSTITINVDPTPSLLRYLPMKEVVITGPVDGLWTINAPLSSLPDLALAKDAVLAFVAEIANKLVLIGVAQAAIDSNVEFATSFDISLHAAMPSRVIGTVYTNSTKLRTVNVAIKLQANATTSTATYHTVIGGTEVAAQFGFVGTGAVAGGTSQFCSFLVDPGAEYSITSVLGTGGGGGNQSILSWVEIDTPIANTQLLALTKQSTAALRVLTNNLSDTSGV